MDKINPVVEDKTSDRNFPASLAPTFFVSNGEKVLGTMYIASGEERLSTVLLINGFPGNEVNSDIAHMLQRHGFNVFSFFPRGSWGSGGVYSWKNLIEDGKEAVKFLRSDTCKEKFKVDGKRIVFMGYSIGGFAVLHNSLLFEDIKNVCAIAPFNIGMFGQFLDANAEVKNLAKQKINTSMDFVVGSSTVKLINEMIEHKTDWNLINYADKLAKKNLLIIGSRFDLTAPIEIHHKPLAQALKTVGANEMKELILECGHSFSDKRIQLMTIISEWFNEIKF
jgi:uncharacterized protein